MRREGKKGREHDGMTEELLRDGWTKRVTRMKELSGGITV